MHRILIGLIVSLGGVASAQPVTPSPAAAVEHETVAQLFASPDAARVAWGARLAANYDRKEFSPELLKLATSSDWRLRMVAIDSLIRLDVDVPEAILIQMADSYLDAAVIFMARRPNESDRLIQDLLTRKLQDHHWVSLHSILLNRPPAGFTSSLLRDWTMPMTVTVLNPSDRLGIGAGGGGGLCGDGGGFDQPGFPSLVGYYLFESPQAGDVVLAAGPHPVGYRKQSAYGRCWSPVNRDNYRKDYLMYLANSPHFELPPGLTIAWTGTPAYQASANEFLSRIRQSVGYLKSRLVERKLLTAEEAANVNPTLDVKVIDQRSRREPELPAIHWTLRPAPKGI